MTTSDRASICLNTPRHEARVARAALTYGSARREGQPTLTFDHKRGGVICGQVITKGVEGKTFDPKLDLSKL